MALNNYNEESIVTLKPRDAIRQNYGMYIGNNDTQGMHHLLTEIIANSMDEAAAGFGKEISVVVNSKVNEVSVIDHGRGIPFRKNKEGNYAIVEMCTSLHSGGKFEGAGNYKSSLGLHGLGASCTQALSKSFEITSVREDGKCTFTVYEGDYEEPLIEDGKYTETGSTVTFIPDPKIFGNCKWDKKTICEELQLHALLNNGLKFELIWDNDKPITYIYSNGLKDLLEIKRGDSVPLTPIYSCHTVINKGLDNEYDIEFMFQYIKEPGEYIYAFTNGGYNPEFGTHVTGWKSGFTSYINKTAKEYGLFGEKQETFAGEIIRRGLLLVLNVKTTERLMFAEQTKHKLTSPGARTACSQAVGDLVINQKDFKAIFEKIQTEQKAENAAKRSREAAQKLAKGGKNINSLRDLPEKLADCQNKGTTCGEIFFVEGDSAGGNAKIERNPNQAIFPLRGKVLNTYSKDLGEIVKNEEVKNILTILGCGIYDNFNIKNLRYDKIIFMADADPDGGHINCLLTALFLRHLPQLIEAGKVYSAVPPLYKVKTRGGTVYCYSEEELKKTPYKQEITRYKGLGEMSSKELYETTMNPDNRKLIQLTMENLDEAYSLYDTIMGESSKLRREFILSHKLGKVSEEDTFDEEGDEE